LSLQHCPVVTAEGHVLIFDNGYGCNFSGSNRHSRGEYKIVGLDVEQIWEYGKERGEDFFSPITSEVQYIEES
jgi:hypothetical protein